MAIYIAGSCFSPLGAVCGISQDCVRCSRSELAAGMLLLGEHFEDIGGVGISCRLECTLTVDFLEAMATKAEVPGI